MREMKDSGVEWIGQIPKNWNVVPLKAYFSFGKGLPITKDNLTEQGIPVISYGQIHAKWNSGVTTHPELMRFVSDSYLQTNPQSLVKKGDFIMADTSEDRDGCGNCAYVDTDEQLFAGYHTIILSAVNNTNNKYLAYLFLSDPWRSQIRKAVSGVKLFSISRRILGKVSILVPDNSEKIVTFLDEKCAKVDALISNNHAQIEKLKTYKQSLITEVVTKGLDPTVPMKDSGVEWIGEIPEHWGTPKISMLATVSSGATPDRTYSEYWNGSISWLKTGELQNNEIYESEEYITEAGLKNSSAQLYEPNTILVAMYGQGKTRGMTALLRIPSTTNQACAGIVVTSALISHEFLWKVLIGAYSGLRELAVGSGQPNLNQALIKNFRVPLPPIREQQEICGFLDKQMPQIDRLIAIKQAKIEKLEQYKKSLIYEYVTGKREVI